MFGTLSPWDEIRERDLNLKLIRLSICQNDPCFYQKADIWPIAVVIMKQHSCKYCEEDCSDNKTYSETQLESFFALESKV